MASPSPLSSPSPSVHELPSPISNGSSPYATETPGVAHFSLDLRYTSTHWVLAFLYLIPLALCIVWRLKPLLQSSAFSFWQIVFVIMMLIGLLARLTFWVMQPFIYSYIVFVRQDFNLYWNLWPGFFFFACYLVILFLWMEIYHSDSEQRKDFRWLFTVLPLTACAAIMFGIVIGLMIADAVFYGQFYKIQKIPMASNPVQTSIVLYDAGLFILASFGFIAYGLLFYWKFRGGNRQPLLQKMRFDILPRVKLLTSLCGLIFTMRAVLIIWSMYGDWAPESWWLDLVYYSILEVLFPFSQVLPIVLMLMVFRPQRSTDPAPVNSMVSERR